jgi:hypothetical protein
MKSILIILLFLSSSVFAQDSPSTFWKDRCDFKTDGTGKSVGLKLKLSVPCKWDQTDGSRAHTLKKFAYNLGSFSAIEVLTIKKLPGELSKSEIEIFFSSDGLKELCSEVGTFISGRKVTIDRLPAGEIEFRMDREDDPVGNFYLYNLYYYIVYKDNLIVVAYSIGSKSAETARKHFEEYKTLFKGLASSSVILSQWED